MLDMDVAMQAVEAPTSAARESKRNWQRNLAAITATQSDLAESIAAANCPVEWIFARDGTLTAFENGKWWCGCSVPAKAAEELLKTLQISATMACFLAPSHPAQIAFALA